MLTTVFENLIDNLDDIYSDLKLFKRKESDEPSEIPNTFLLFPKAKKRPEFCIVSMKEEESKVFLDFMPSPASNSHEKMIFVGYD